MATEGEVEQILRRLVARLERLDPSYRPLLPRHRVLEAEFLDLGITYHAEWRGGRMSNLRPGPAERPHIRFLLDSDDLVDMVNGELGFRRAYATNRVRLEASMTDLLRLQGFL